MNKRRRIEQIIAILVIIILIVGIYIIKNGGIGDLQGSVDQSFSSSREGIIPLEMTSFDPEMISSSEKPMLLVLGESWCQPCLRMMDDLKELHRTVDDVEIRYIDLEENYGFFSETDETYGANTVASQLYSAMEGYVEMGNYSESQLESVMAADSFVPDPVISIYESRQ